MRREPIPQEPARTPQPWEAVDPQPPVIHSSVPGDRGEAHRRAN